MKRLFFFLTLLTLVTASCQGNTTTQTPDAEAVREASSAAQSPVRAESSPTTENPDSTPTQANKELTSAPAGCTVISPRPTPGPTEQSVFPPVVESDWVYGPDNAAITLIEYSDFQ